MRDCIGAQFQKRRFETEVLNMKVWITKYALTDGIIEAQHVENIPPHDGMIQAYFYNKDNQLKNDYYKEDELFYGKQSAIKKAEEMRKKKIASLKKQIEKLERMRFE